MALIRYHGRKEVELEPGDLFRYVLVSGRQGTAVFLESIPEDPIRMIPRARLLMDGNLEELNLNTFFNIKKL